MSKQRYWTIGCSIGFTSPCNKTKKVDICHEIGITEDDLELMSDKEIEDQMQELADEYGQERLSCWAKPASA